jgi:hypothetical protein
LSEANVKKAIETTVACATFATSSIEDSDLEISEKKLVEEFRKRILLRKRAVDEFKGSVRRLITVLNRRKIKYANGLAVSYYGLPRTTLM